MDLFQSVIIAIIEGLTEFLPVSSTGHMILASAAMKINENEFVKTFEIVIQIGAIMAIVLMYIKRFLRSFEIYIKLAVAFIPTAIIGFLAYDFIKNVLFSPLVVSVSLVVGGIILIIIDRHVVRKSSEVTDLEKIPLKNAFFIGLVQCISMIPGVSRAAATIVGGVFNRFDKKQATEFSFLLAVPTMLAASGYDLLKTPVSFTQNEIILLLTGLFVAFVTAWFAVKIFLKIVERYGFKHFGYYRIIIGVIFFVVFIL
ncbi:MAG TPA: undecaprenyl-diphosphate phosphatase [Bacteroidales bacterium]|nr:undecaprenyl-diphosphate phosphatase [Bacteroidales bacterium]